MLMTANSALSVLMIPNLNVDPFNKTVSTRQGNTLLCINGREASMDEIKTWILKIFSGLISMKAIILNILLLHR